MPSSRLLSGIVIVSLVTALAVCGDARAEPLVVVVPRQVMLVDLQVPDKAPWKAAREAATSKLVELAKRNGARTFGFEVAPAVENDLKVLNPLKEATVDVGALKSYEQDVSPASLVRFHDRLIFPIVVQGKVVSSFTLRLDGNEWKPVAFGSTNLIRAAMQTRIRVATVRNSLVFRDKKADYGLVAVTGLNLHFLYAKGPIGPYLVALYDSSRYGWSAGVPLSLKEVFARLKPDAFPRPAVLAADSLP